jgi:hypothetical protein
MGQDDRGVVVGRVGLLAGRSSTSATPKSSDG